MANPIVHFLQIMILAAVQGAAELLPISSSAHVILAEKLMGLDPTAPDMTLLLVMLHTGTMFAVIVYFWQAWRARFFESGSSFRRSAWQALVATGATGAVGLALLLVLKSVVGHGAASFQIEQLFGDTRLIAAALAAAGLLIIASSHFDRGGDGVLNTSGAFWIGAVQGLCLPFRGFSRSGATISTGLALGVSRQRAEEFSFALAVILTPVAIGKEGYRAIHAQAAAPAGHALGLAHLLAPSLLGMILSFLAGLVALKWLSSWLERGRWHYFGVYCLLASAVVLMFR